MRLLEGADGASLERLVRDLGLDADARQLSHLESYLALLQRWNRTYNLTAVRDPAQMLVQHVADCLAVVGPLKRHLHDRPTPRVVDVGSGGGLPGAVLAVMWPQLQVICIDAVGKKAAFVRQVAAELRLPNLFAEHSRVEALKGVFGDVVVSRAFASLADFVQVTQHLHLPGGVWLAMKGKVPQEEIADLNGLATVFHVEQLQVPHLNAERCLVWLRPPVEPLVHS